MSALVKQLAEELHIDEGHARNAIHLLFEEKGTIPFITRYRKEKTGSMSEVVLCKLRDRYVYMQDLEATKERYLKVIEEHAKEKPEVLEKLPQIRAKIAKCTTKQELEDIYLPFKPKRKTRASTAREKGLEPLLQAIFAQWGTLKDLNELARPYIKTDGVPANLQVADEEDALRGAADIFAEQINETAEYRNIVRRISHASGMIVARKNERFPTDPESLKLASKYENYFEYREDIQKAPSHRVMAVRRGEAEKVLVVNIEVDEEGIRSELYQTIKSEKGVDELSSELDEWFKRALADAYKRLLAPAIETEIRMEIKIRSENEAIRVFASNLRNLLLLPPTPGHVVCGVDPGLRTGAKIAIVSETGSLLEHTVIYPKMLKAPRKNAPKAADTQEAGGEAPEDEVDGNRKEELPSPVPPVSAESQEAAPTLTMAEQVLRKLFETYKVTCIALGNGTGSREIDQVLLNVIRAEGFQHIKRYIVNESGASVYSTDEIAREEFPDLDPTIRSAVSIARRLQDPLAELVKIDPRSLGVGQYQHDCEVSKLDRSLQETVESCVNSVGVDLNTASFKLLSYVSGIGHALAKNMVAYRDQSGAFHSRQALLEIPGFGPKTFEQAAGFLRVPNADNALDNSSVHPERYKIVEKIAEDLHVPVQEMVGKDELVKSIPLEKYVDEEIGMPTLLDIVKELAKPGRDPRQDNERLHYSTDVTSINDLKAGMRLRGTVSNVTKFGCFVDIGVHQDGLVHVSELPRSGGDPESIVAVGQILEVYVKGVDIDRNRISLSTRKDASSDARAQQGASKKAPSTPYVPGPSPISPRSVKEEAPAAPVLKPSGGPTIKPVEENKVRSKPLPPRAPAPKKPQHGQHAKFTPKSAPANSKQSFSLDDLMSKFNNRI